MSTSLEGRNMRSSAFLNIVAVAVGIIFIATNFVSGAEYGGDFSAQGLSSGSSGGSPGADPGTMGKKPASAMAIGTGSSGAGDYSSQYKTPNYTQYTQQDFKGLKYFPSCILKAKFVLKMI
jgi:hypothetical protein